MPPIYTRTGGGGGGSGDGPETLVDVTFADLTTQDLTSSGDGNYTLSDGTVLAVSNSTNADTLAVTNGTGLEAEVTGAGGSYKATRVAVDLSGFSTLTDYDAFRFFVEVVPDTMAGATEGPDAVWMYYTQDPSGTVTDGVYSRFAKYSGDSDYDANYALNGMSLGPNPTGYGGGPTGDWGNLSTTSLPSVARLEMHGTDVDVWLRGDTGTSGLPDRGTMTLRARLRLQAARFEATDDVILGDSGFVVFEVATYNEISVAIKRIAIQRYGTASS